MRVDLRGILAPRRLMLVAAGAGLLLALILLLSRHRGATNAPGAGQPASTPRQAPEGLDQEELPVEAEKVVDGSQLLIRVLYDRPIGEDTAARYCRSQLSSVDMGKLGRSFYAQYGCVCSKVVVEVFTAPEPFEYLKGASLPEKTELNLWVYAAWRNFGEEEPRPSNAFSFLPGRVDDMHSRLKRAGSLGLAQFQCLDRRSGAFEARYFEVDSLTEAREALVELAGVHGWGTQTMRLLGVLPELRSLRLVVPVKGGRELVWTLTREDVVAAFRMGRRYFDRHKSLLDRESDIFMRHMEGKLTKREATLAEELVKSEARRFVLDLYQEFDDHLRAQSER